MTDRPEYRTPRDTIDVMEVERQARALRAQVFSDTISGLRRRIAEMFRADGRTA